MKRLLLSILVLLVTYSYVSAFSLDGARNEILKLFNKYDLVGISELHRVKECHELLRMLVPGLAKQGVRNIVVEFGNAKFQNTADRYIKGEPVQSEDVSHIWRDTGQFLVWDSPIYEEFFRTVRDINLRLPESKKIRVLLGDPPIGWEIVHTKADYYPFGDRDLFFGGVVESEVLNRGQKALLIAGALHWINEREPKKEVPDSKRSIGSLLHRRHPGKLFALWSAQIPETECIAPCIMTVRGSRFEKSSFSAFAPKGILVQKLIDGEKKWVPLETSDWPTTIEMADGIIDYGQKKTEIGPSAKLYQDTSYVKELRRRSRILSDVYGMDFTEQLETVVNESAKKELF